MCHSFNYKHYYIYNVFVQTTSFCFQIFITFLLTEQYISWYFSIWIQSAESIRVISIVISLHTNIQQAAGTGTCRCVQWDSSSLAVLGECFPDSLHVSPIFQFAFSNYHHTVLYFEVSLLASTQERKHMGFAFVQLILPNILSSRSILPKLQHSIVFCGNQILHCVYIPHFPYLPLVKAHLC